MRPCPFCAILGGEADARLVYEDDMVLAFLDRSPLAIGHCLLIPRVHLPTLFHADAPTLAALAVASQRVGAAMMSAMEADGLFVGQNNIVSQSVPHLHIHLVPRRRGDGLFAKAMVWRRVRYRDEAHRAETAERIRAALTLERG